MYASQAEPHPTLGAEKAMIPLIGGAHVNTVRPLLPLALSRDEWQEIGERMGWAKYRLSADKEQRA